MILPKTLPDSRLTGVLGFRRVLPVTPPSPAEDAVVLSAAAGGVEAET